MNRQAFIIENLQKHTTIAELRHSDFFKDHREEIESILRTPQVCFFSGSSPHLQSFIRAVQWNIEKGKRFEAILDKLQNDEVLKWADVIMLNEADQGMNRSQNRHVALCLAKELGMHMAFAAAHFELTKGTDDELTLKGENQEALQGNAVLSRYPILEVQVNQLPVCFEHYEFHEKRYGRRNCLWVKLQVGRNYLWVGSVHLEVRNTPRCRARQIKHILENLPGEIDEAYLLGGDLNSNSFRRGKMWRTIESVLRLIVSSPANMKERLLHPERGSEPLFQILKQHRFDWQGINTNDVTSCAPIASLEENSLFPNFVTHLIQKRLERYHGYLCFKLDWMLGRGIQALHSGEECNDLSGVVSLGPGCRNEGNIGPDRISDHFPIHTDLRLGQMAQNL